MSEGGGCPHGFIPWQECSLCLRDWYELHRDDATRAFRAGYEAAFVEFAQYEDINYWKRAYDEWREKENR